MNSLTRGASYRIYHGNETDLKPIMQVMEAKQIAGNKQERYRVILNDGVHFFQSVVATQLNYLIQNGSLKQYCLVKVNDYACNNVSDRKVVVVLDLEIVGPGEGRVYGSPTNVEQATSNVAAQNNSNSNNNNTNSSFGNQQSNSFGMQKKPNQQPQRSNFGASGFGSTPYSDADIRSIDSLNPYQNHWVIKARVTQKGDIRHWSNARGEGKLFSVNLLDREGGEMRATMFNDAADKFYPIFQVNKVYIISRGHLKMANKRYAIGNTEYEIHLNADAEVHHVEDDNGIQAQRFNFTSIADLVNLPENTVTDVIGVVSQVGDLQTIISKAKNKEVNKREIVLRDTTNASVNLTLWGQEAETYDEQTLANNPILAVKGTRVSDFNGKSLSASFNSQVFINVDRKEAHDLRTWWDTNGSHSAVTANLSAGRGGGNRPTERKRLCAIKDEQLGVQEAAYLAVKGTITYVKADAERPPWYKACTNGDCKKKVNESNNGGYHCVKCNMDMATCQNRYILSCLCCDDSASTWISLFNDQAEALIGVPADQLAQMLENGDTETFESTINRANHCTRLFKIKAKMEEDRQDASRLKCTVLSTEPINYEAECTYLLENISKMEV